MNFREYEDYIESQFERNELAKLFNDKDKQQLANMLITDLNKDNEIQLSTDSKDLSKKEIKL